jgi:anaerobic selenocysteine-containing dehydrogenase
VGNESIKPRAEWVTGICGICPGGCGVKVKRVEGRIEKILPLRGHPVGVVCVRGLHSREIVYSEDRLKQPLLRVGEKGEGKFKGISWDEALDRIAGAFFMIREIHGARAVMSYFGRGSFDSNLGDVFGTGGLAVEGTSGFLFPFGSPNSSGVSSICYVSYGILASMSTLGVDMQSLVSDFAHTDLVVVWGANPPTDSPPDKVKKILEAKKRGARVIVIDPMRSDMAKMADQWIGVRSGTDGALALSLMNVILREGLYDKAFVRNWTTGFEELRQYVRKFPPEVVEKITWVPRETISALAREIAGAKGASLVMYTGLEYTGSGVQNIRSVLCLWGITGNIDSPGGLVFRPRSRARFPRVKLEPPKGVRPIGADRYPFFCELLRSAQFMEAPRAILNNDPYPVRALLVFGASLITSLPADTPIAAKKQIVAASLEAFGVPVDGIIEAGAAEIEALEAYIRAGAADTQQLLTESESRIRQFEEEIARIRARREARVAEQQEVVAACNARKLEVQRVLEFFGQDAVASVVKSSPRLHDPSADPSSSQ